MSARERRRRKRAWRMREVLARLAKIERVYIRKMVMHHFFHESPFLKMLRSKGETASKGTLINLSREREIPNVNSIETELMLPLSIIQTWKRFPQPRRELQFWRGDSRGGGGGERGE